MEKTRGDSMFLFEISMRSVLKASHGRGCRAVLFWLMENCDATAAEAKAGSLQSFAGAGTAGFLHKRMTALEIYAKKSHSNRHFCGLEKSLRRMI